MKFFRVKILEGITYALEQDGYLYAISEKSLMARLSGAGDEVAPLGKQLGHASDLTLLSPVLPGKIIAIGLNYRDHIKEAGLEVPSSPLIFAKFPSSVTGPYDPVLIDSSLTARVDWEVELGVVIGQKMRNVPVSDALDYILGYTAVNDVSARDVQFGDGQWTRGKSFDTFCPIGPGIVTPEEISDPQSLSLRTYLNGETVQHSSTSEMLFPVAELLSYCSRCFTLEPNDIILTGTPWGCGEFMTPRRSLKPGDLIEVEVEAIGRLSNPVVAVE